MEKDKKEKGKNLTCPCAGLTPSRRLDEAWRSPASELTAGGPRLALAPQGKLVRGGRAGTPDRGLPVGHELQLPARAKARPQGSVTRYFRRETKCISYVRQNQVTHI
jgi:hypothetical protein